MLNDTDQVKLEKVKVIAKLFRCRITDVNLWTSYIDPIYNYLLREFHRILTFTKDSLFSKLIDFLEKLPKDFSELSTNQLEKYYHEIKQYSLFFSGKLFGEKLLALPVPHGKNIIGIKNTGKYKFYSMSREYWTAAQHLAYWENLIASHLMKHYEVEQVKPFEIIATSTLPTYSP